MKLLIGFLFFLSSHADACCSQGALEARAYLTDFVTYDAIRVPAGCWMVGPHQECFKQAQNKFIATVNAYIREDISFKSCLETQSISTELSAPSIQDQSTVEAIRNCFQ